jgi:predicted kinase
MGIPRLMIVCGVPGAGKSTLALHAVDRWGAVSFASETFADELGAAGRTASGDLTGEAIAHAYAAMGAAVTSALATSKLVLSVGSFRAEEQRRRFRAIATTAGAAVTTLRIASPVDTAAKRVRMRIARGERGPTETTIDRIDADLSRASDIDAVMTNDASIEHFYRRADAMMEFLVWDEDRGPPAATAFVERLEELAACDLALVRDLIAPKRLGVATCPPNEAAATEQEIRRSRNRIKELQKCLLVGRPSSIKSDIESALKKATDKWVNAVDRLALV